MRLRRALAIQRAISFAGVTRASWVVEARGWADSVGTGLTISADRILGAVRTTVGEHQRLVEAQCLVRMSLLRREKSEDGGSEVEVVKEIREASSDVVAGGLVWKQQFELTKKDFDQKVVNWSVFVEEVERLRPATYPDEPRYGTKNDSAFAETGLRFAARLELNELLT